MRGILSNLSVANIALAAVLIVFANYTFFPMFSKSSKLRLSAPKKQASAPAAAVAKPVDSKSPSPSDFFIIAEQNIFHPERKIPVEKKDAAPPLPKPEFVLYGTLMLDDIRIAYMEDKKAPQNTPTRGKKQIPLRLGEALSGFTLKEIDADKVVMVRGTETLEVYLNDASKSKSREGAAGIPVAQALPAGQQPQPVAQSTPQQQHTPQQPAARAPAATVQGQNPQPSEQQPQARRQLFRRARNLD
jgi:hypothetical protein